MDEITSNRHAGVVILSIAIVVLGLLSTFFGTPQKSVATQAIEPSESAAHVAQP